MGWQDLRIETDRLILHPTRPEDFEGWTRLMGNEENSHFSGEVMEIWSQNRDTWMRCCA